jgi:DNA polymerase-3 subunit delta'
LRLKQFIGEKDQRNKVGMCHDLSLRPLVSSRRVAIIDDADDLQVETANCLLKTLEEPPPRSVIILLGTSLAKQLPTIRSRSQVVRFAPLSADDIAAILVERQIEPDGATANELAHRSGGSVAGAIAAHDQALWQFRAEFLEKLSTPRVDSVGLAQAVGDFVNEAGKEAPPRRVRLRHIIGFAAELYRAVLHGLVSDAAATATGDRPLHEASQRMLAQHVTADGAVRSIQSCLAAEENVARNANQATLIQWWLADLASQLGRSRA